MKRLNWFLAMTIPLLVFVIVSLSINKFLIVEPLRTILSLSTLGVWVTYSIVVWIIPDRDGGFK